MNTQLAEEQQKSLPMGEALALAVNIMQAAYEADVDQNDLMIDEIERLRNENTFMKLQIQNLTARVNDVTGQNEQLSNTVNEFENRFKALAKQKDVVLANAEKHMQMLEQAQRQEQQVKNEVKDLKIQLKAYKEIANSPKKVREKIADFKARLVKEKGFTDQHKKNYLAEKAETKLLKKEIMSLAHKLSVSDIIQLHGEGDDRICLFPHQLGNISGYEDNQVPLLYMHTSGRASLVLLNNDGEAEIPASPKGGLRMKKATMDHCSQLLRRFKSQGWTLTDSDVKSIAMQN